jgi:hypothetical protein
MIRALARDLGREDQIAGVRVPRYEPGLPETLTDTDFVRLQVTLNALIDPRTDRVLLCDLGDVLRARRTITYLGQIPHLTGDRDALIL